MNKVVATLTCGALVAMFSIGSAAVPKDEQAADFIRSLGAEVLQVLENDGLSRRDRVSRFYGLFRSAFDEERVSSFALGKYRHTIGPRKFDEYRELFGKYMTGLYATKFADYSGESFTVTGSSREEDGGSRVAAEIHRPNGQPIRLAFKISRENSEMKIVDVVIEGVSLLFAKRQEVTSVIARDGLETLLDRLREAVQLAELN